MLNIYSTNSQKKKKSIVLRQLNMFVRKHRLQASLLLNQQFYLFLVYLKIYNFEFFINK